MSKKVLLTGASGFVGANLARHLLQAGHEVHLLLRKPEPPWRLAEIWPDVRPHQADLLDEEGLQKRVAQIRPDWIFHLGVYGAYSTQNDLNTILQTNLMGTSYLVQACLKKGFEAFVNTGSSSEYGYKDHAPHEQEWLDPNSFYAIAKAASTHYCRYVSLKEDCPITTLRLYSVYGAYEEASRLLPTLITSGLAGKLPPLVNPEIARDFIYIEDVNRAYLQTAEASHLRGEVFNIGSGKQTSLREVVEIARQVLNIPSEPEWGSMAERHWDTSVWVANLQHSREALGWNPSLDFPAGFAKMVDWIKQHKALYP